VHAEGFRSVGRWPDRVPLSAVVAPDPEGHSESSLAAPVRPWYAVDWGLLHHGFSNRGGHGQPRAWNHPAAVRGGARSSATTRHAVTIAQLAISSAGA
jgi:hypothetical protein